MTYNCRVCGVELTDENWYPSFQKRGSRLCKECNIEKCRLYYEANKDKVNARHHLQYINNPEKYKTMVIKNKRKNGILPFDENEKCSSYFGINVVERALRNVYTDVQRMPMNNPGYDFVCNKGKKVDSKGACIRKNRNNWEFNIRRNTIPDYFCCIAFDNREDLNPLHMWMLPGDKFNHLMTASISPNTLDKWSEYEKPVDELITCCNAIRKL